MLWLEAEELCVDWVGVENFCVLFLGHVNVIHEPVPVCDEELSRNMDMQDILDIPNGQEPSI